MCRISASWGRYRLLIIKFWFNTPTVKTSWFYSINFWLVISSLRNYNKMSVKLAVPPMKADFLLFYFDIVRASVSIYFAFFFPSITIL